MYHFECQPHLLVRCPLCRADTLFNNDEVLAQYIARTPDGGQNPWNTQNPVQDLQEADEIVDDSDIIAISSESSFDSLLDVEIAPPVPETRSDADLTATTQQQQSSILGPRATPDELADEELEVSIQD